ncbi:Alginate biosynthesis protein AlgA [Actinomadura rubteroloni]|uniref:Alginate biosynthesis protein AlgA n=1 Tax=Actinomadura rubteroloni TaxID=1926885 RepID=A0A2P4UF71_9ACTN|nr:phosphomannose isomerase type II C-terminal cupin domain [Actinomadura rubteroloni]POM23662.1 Alginate biosynthesis protein AlgA [Actinomadura rubteroloni]
MTTTESRPWGSYTVVDESPAHKTKRIEVAPGSRLSYQRHRHRSEHWYVLAGTLHVTIEGAETVLLPGQSVDVPAGSAHRAANHGDVPAVFVEVQTGTYFGEDDIERLDDDYGRAGAGAVAQ